MQIDTDVLFQYLRPQTLKRVLGDIAECKREYPDDEDADAIRDAVMQFAAGPWWDDQDRVTFMMAP
jgi:hypothetical protein